MTLAEMGCVDSIGIPRFQEKQAQAMVNMVKSRRLLESEPPACEGSGVVIVGGGKYLSWSHVLCKRLRTMGCQLPIQVWHLGSREMPNWAKPHFAKLDVETVDIYEVMKSHPVRQMSGWIAKSYAVRHCPWERVVFIDADCFPEVLPEKLLANEKVVEAGSLLFKDVGRHHPDQWGYMAFALLPLEHEFETGQFIWHKTKAWKALRWTLWCSEHTDVFYKMFHGDKGVIEVCFRSTNTPFVTGERSEWAGYGIAHYLDGEHVFSHCMGIKRGEFPKPKWMQNFFAEWDSLALGKI